MITVLVPDLIGFYLGLIIICILLLRQSPGSNFCFEIAILVIKSAFHVTQPFRIQDRTISMAAKDPGSVVVLCLGLQTMFLEVFDRETHDR